MEENWTVNLFIQDSDPSSLLELEEMIEKKIFLHVVPFQVSKKAYLNAKQFI